MFFQAQETVLSAIGGCSVEQCRVLRRVRCGIRLRPAGLRRDKVYRQITCMRHRSLNNFHKKWDNNKKFFPDGKCCFCKSKQRESGFSGIFRNNLI